MRITSTIVMASVLITTMIQRTNGTQRIEHRTVFDYEMLLNSLASRNSAPKFDASGKVIDQAFDMNEITRVAKLLESIEPRNVDEWRILVTFTEDNRYCISGYRQSPRAVQNYNVGALCSRVARYVVYSRVGHAYSSLKLPVPDSVKWPELKQSVSESRNALVESELLLIQNGEHKSKISTEVTEVLVEKIKKLRGDKGEEFVDYSFADISWLGESPGKRQK